MSKFGLVEINHIEMDHEGWVNPCFFVNSKYVFRFNARDPHLPKYQREFFVYQLLKEHHLPVPQMVLLDDSKTISSFDVLITEMLDGKNLEKTWSQLEKKEAEALAFQAGALLRKINDISFDYFGEISGKKPFSRHQSWYNYLKEKLSYHLDEACSFQFFNKQETEDIWNIFQLAKPALDQVKKAQLVHVDYHLGNLLHNEGKISGVLDFEWTLAGDPLYDFNRWKTLQDEILIGSRQAFLNGYSLNSFNESEFLRMKIYQMIFNIEITVVAHRHFPMDEAVTYFKETKTNLLELKNSITLEENP